MSWFALYMSGWGAWIFGGSAWLHYLDAKLQKSSLFDNVPTRDLSEHIMLGMAGCLWPLGVPSVALYHMAKASVSVAIRAASEVRAIAAAEVAYRKLIIDRRMADAEAEMNERARILEAPLEELVDAEIERRKP